MPIRPNPTLSEDLIGEILVRVPVKSLLCLQLVCKTWLSLIKHPAFVKSQLLRAIKTQTDQILVRNYAGPRGYISLLDVSSRQIVSDLKLPNPRGKSNIPKLIGSVNGIVCVTHVGKEESIYLWNPATRQFKLIPPPSTKCFPLGFGYDPIDDEYKVVSFRSRECYSAEVYLANRDEWRTGPVRSDIPYPIEMEEINRFDVCVNGFLCGIENHFMLAVFDLHKEVLNCAIKLPVIIRKEDDEYDDIYDYDDDIYEYDDDQTQITEFNKSIAVITMWFIGRKDSYKKVNMWMLDDDACLGSGGVEASWTLMFSIDVADPAQLNFGYSHNRNLLILIGNRWISYSVENKEIKIIPLSVEMAGHLYCHVVYKYLQSLVSLPGFKQINWNAGEDNNLRR